MLAAKNVRSISRKRAEHAANAAAPQPQSQQATMAARMASITMAPVTEMP